MKTSRPSISACIISYNEERNIAECLDSVSWCDEVVVVDAFSSDATAEIARQRGARVVQAEWCGNVAQKNRALDEATSDWVLSLDCDERVTESLEQSIARVFGSESPAAGYYISRKLFYLGRWLEHGGWFPEWRLRLLRREAGRWVGTDPHDTVRVDGETARILPTGRGPDAAVLLHYSFRNLSHQLEVLDRYTEIQSGELHRARGSDGTSARVRSAVALGLRPLWRFLQTYILRLGFLDGAAGYHMAINHAYAAYMKYAKLWQLDQGLTLARAKSELVPADDETRKKRIREAL